MTVQRSLLLWLGVFAPPLAWAAQLVVGYAAEEADCSAGSGSFDASHLVTVWTSVAAGGVTALSLLAAGWLWRETRSANDRGRIPFLAAVGVLNGLLFLALIVLTAVGATHFEPCRPG